MVKFKLLQENEDDILVIIIYKITFILYVFQHVNNTSNYKIGPFGKLNLEKYARLIRISQIIVPMVILKKVHDIALVRLKYPAKVR